MKNEFHWLELETLIQQISEQQKNYLMTCAKRIVPQITPDDLLQPNDFPALENNPSFRYEEGLLAGIQTIEMALRAARHS